MSIENSRSQPITILTMGSRGDVEPYVALGRGLVREGYPVRIATLEPFRDFVEANALEFRAVPDPLLLLEASPEWKKWQSSEVGLWKKLGALQTVLRCAMPSMIRNMDACVEACRGSRAILSSFTGFAGPYVAELLGISHLWALLQPCTPTRHCPNFLLPWSRINSRFYNLGSHYAADAGFRWLFGPSIRAWRSERARGWSHAEIGIPGKRGPVLYGFSPVLVPRPEAWGPDLHITGHWRLETPGSWIPPDLLVSFLAGHQNVVCLCHSSITGWRCPGEAFDLLVDAVRMSGYPGIIISGLRGTVAKLSDSCLAVDAVPFGWLLPRVRLMVHHGGAGTTGEVLQAGRPSIVMPSCFDQRFWAQALHRLGIAACLLQPHRVTASALSGAIREAISNTRFASNAERCAGKVHTEDGVRSAVEVLQGYLAKQA